MRTTLHRLVLAIVIATSAVSCTTAYDAYGRPHDVVDPGAALVGAAAVGLLAYGLGSSSHHHHYRNDGYYARSRYHHSHGGYGYSRYNRGYCSY